MFIGESYMLPAVVELKLLTVSLSAGFRFLHSSIVFFLTVFPP